MEGGHAPGQPNLIAHGHDIACIGNGGKIGFSAHNRNPYHNSDIAQHCVLKNHLDVDILIRHGKDQSVRKTGICHRRFERPVVNGLIPVAGMSNRDLLASLCTGNHLTVCIISNGILGGDGIIICGGHRFTGHYEALGCHGTGVALGGNSLRTVHIQTDIHCGDRPVRGCHIITQTGLQSNADLIFMVCHKYICLSHILTVGHIVPCNTAVKTGLAIGHSDKVSASAISQLLDGIIGCFTHSRRIHTQAHRGDGYILLIIHGVEILCGCHDEAIAVIAFQFPEFDRGKTADDIHIIIKYLPVVSIKEQVNIIYPILLKHILIGDQELALGGIVPCNAVFDIGIIFCSLRCKETVAGILGLHIVIGGITQ